MGHSTRLRRAITSAWWFKILEAHDTEPTELSGGLLKITISIWLLMPFQAISPAFGVVSLIPEFWWSIFLMVVGVGHLAALRNGHVAWRRWGSLVGFCVWGALALSLWSNGVLGLAPFLFLGAAVSQAWVYIRLGYIVRQHQ